VDVQAKGYKPKSKTLEEVLKSSRKMEAKLIGYDETPIDVNTPEAIGFEKSTVQPSSGDFEPQIFRLTKVSDNNISCITPAIKKQFGALRGQPSRTIENHSCDPDSQTTGIVIVVAGYQVRSNCFILIL
jgi:endoribonuclease Dicer